jgi:hypothetical protein
VRDLADLPPIPRHYYPEYVLALLFGREILEHLVDGFVEFLFVVLWLLRE